MNPDIVKSPSQLADEARGTAGDAFDTAKNFAQASRAVSDDALSSVKDSLQDSADDAKVLGRDAASAARSYARDARQTGKDAIETGRAYAQDAVNAAGKKVADIKDQLSTARKQSEQYIMDQPVRATLIAAAGGAVLTALLVSFMRKSDRR
ncbi:hypothetical protein H7F36_17565 [Variovorax sp. PAMC28562]|uniref:hypothetical protein n=1 Tax=Variovorax sp. PAMC28562 TaxID=2762323 RepID=UPI00164DA47B|nr:hypothetical protein [Variovorax sp. PAMC28562]QNK72959.1 hypothetical protein H7F36_17565 [Variovorax sp. PAMC28562]